MPKLLISLVLLLSSSALAQDRAEWFRSLKIPGTQTTCCDISDCRVAEKAEYRDGHWWAEIRRKMVQIPDQNVVKDPPSIDGRAWECSNPEYVPIGPSPSSLETRGPIPLTIYCFIPPSSGV